MQQAQQQMQQTIQTVGQLNAAITAHTSNPTQYDRSQQSHFGADIYNVASVGALFGAQPFAAMSNAAMRGGWYAARYGAPYAGRMAMGAAGAGWGAARGLGSLVWENPTTALTLGLGGAAAWHEMQPTGGQSGSIGQLLSSLSAFGLRSNLQPGQIGEASAWGSTSGMGSGASIALVQQVQQALRGLSVQAIDAQTALRELGVATRDPVKATSEAMSKLAGFRAGERRTELGQAIFGGNWDPAMLGAAAMARSHPAPDTLRAYQMSIQKRINEQQGLSAEAQDQLDARAESETWKQMLPGVSIPTQQTAQRFLQQIMGSSDVRSSNTLLNSQIFRKLHSDYEQPGMPGSLMRFADPRFWSAEGRGFRNAAAGLPGLGFLAPGKEEYAQGATSVGIQASGAGKPEAQTSPEGRRAITTILESLGARYAPQVLQSRQEQAQSDLEQLVAGGHVSKADETRLKAMMDARIARLNDPVGTALMQMGAEAGFAGMPAGQAAVSRAVFLRNQEAISSGITDDQGRPGLSATQEGQVASTVRLGQTNSVSQQLEALGRETEEMRKLGDATKDGAGAMAEVKAAFQAHEDALKSGATAAQEAQEKTLLLGEAFETLRMQAESLARNYAIEAQESGALPSAGAAGPQALRAAQRGIRIRGQFREFNEMGPGPQSGLSVGGAIGGQSGQVQSVLHTALSAEGERLRAMCATLVNEALKSAGLPTSGNSFANSFLKYGQGIGASQVHSGDIFYSGPSGRGDTGHVGVTLGGVVNGRVQVMSSHMAGASSNPAGVEWRSASGLQFRHPPYGGGAVASGGSLEGQSIVNADIAARNQAIGEANAQSATTGLVTGAVLGSPNGVAGQFRGSATRAVLGTDVPYSEGAVSAEVKRQAEEAARSGYTSLQQANDARRESLRLEQQLAEAARQGPAAEKEIADQIQINNQFRQAENDAIQSGNRVLQQRVQQEKSVAESQAAASRDITQTGARNQAAYGRDQELTGMGLQYGAMQTGADAYEKEKIVLQQVNAEKARSIKMTQEELAAIEKYADQVVHVQDEMQDYQRAQEQLKSTLSGAVDTAQQGIMGMIAPEGRTPIQRKINRMESVRNMGLGFINEGVNTFIKQPAENLVNNAISGKENTGVGIGSVIMNALGFGGKPGADNSKLLDNSKSGDSGLSSAASNLTGAANALKSAASALGGGHGGSGSGAGAGGGGTAKGGASNPYGDSGGSGGDLGNVVGDVSGAAGAFTGAGRSGNYAGAVEKAGGALKGLTNMATKDNSSNGGFFGSLIGGGNSVLGKWMGLGTNSGSSATGGLSSDDLSYLGGDIPGLDGDVGSFVSSFHTGGVAGNPSGQQRYVPNWVFSYAPRYHSGTKGAGLAPDEVPAVLKRGEVVTPAGGSAGAAHPPIIYSPMNVFANDAGSFRASGKQLAGAQQRSLDRAQRAL
jgi:hypothetical protein